MTALNPALSGSADSGPSPRFPSLSAIRAFEAAFRLGSFERAGEELAITPSAISKRVSALEDLLGVQLLSRNGRGVNATPDGQEYFELATTALELLSSARLHRRVGPQKQRLQVCVPPTFATEVLVRYLGQFQHMHPELVIEITLSVPFMGLRPPGADVEILAGPRPELPSLTLAPTPVQPVCSPEYLRQYGPFDVPETLRRAALISTPLEPWRRWFLAAGLPWQEPTDSLQLMSLGLAMEAAASGLGVALAHLGLAKQWIDEGKLVPLFDLRVAPNTMYSVHVAAGHRSDLGNGFTLWLAAVCAGIAADVDARLQSSAPPWR